MARLVALRPTLHGLESLLTVVHGWDCMQEAATRVRWANQAVTTEVTIAKYVLSSPEVRPAMKRQTSGVA